MKSPNTCEIVGRPVRIDTQGCLAVSIRHSVALSVLKKEACGFPFLHPIFPGGTSLWLVSIVCGMYAAIITPGKANVSLC